MSLRARSGMLLAIALLATFGTGWAAKPAYLLEDFSTTQLIIDTSGSGCVLFDVYIAQTPAQRSQGLMHIESMGEFEGMIFLYAQESRISMWMKNTLISLDMLFIDRQRQIVSIHENATPMSEAIIDSGKDVVAVVELNSGAVQRFNITTADTIIFPAG